ncbi:hypothetical protein JYU34_004669 [Plutella xylostella]|uniref:Reverse transcriptase domain-containing protein n=1 Tax=Plutella xylostella TaxID=51655 RepID=A0ABQ7QYK7_PLUXY|nr:hypothetical protein JYU34_004669 [Plutella xylostella]
MANNNSNKSNINACRFVSFNCKSIKRSVDCVRMLCKDADIVALQETWLYSFDLAFLGSIDDQFSYTGKSAIDTSVGILRGRPYGGVAILWRKSVFSQVQLVECNSERITGIKITTDDQSILVLNVYMPTDSAENLLNFTECLCEVNAVIENSDVEAVYILGDFNAHPHTFCNEMLNFCAEQQWKCADFEILGMDSGTYTYVSESHGTRRWLDHFLVTESAYNTITDVKVLYDVYWSDHLPITFQCNLSVIRRKVYADGYNCNKVIWGNREGDAVNSYKDYCNSFLKNIDFPSELRFCCDDVCNQIDHRKIIDNMYNNLVTAISQAATLSSTYNVKPNRKKYIIGWNKYVRQYHASARSHFQFWVALGRPSGGPIYNNMCESRKLFKLKLKWCQNNSDQIKMDILATLRKEKHFGKFWKCTNKLNLKPSLPASVEGKCEPKDIANRFKEHFKVEPCVNKKACSNNTDLSNETRLRVRFSAKDVLHTIKHMTRGKSPGHDGLSIEHLQNAGAHLPRILCMFYNLCISHSYLPQDMIETIVVPVIKNKTGDISSISNYRPISLATIVAKVFDGLIEGQLSRYIKLHDAQFGFRPGLSTETAILALKHTVKYYTDRKTSVFACFLDLSKAFDLVSYDILWEKCRELNVPHEVVNILRFWYQNQMNKVRWGTEHSDRYKLDCGVRQGGLSSPLLFNVYVDSLIDELSRTHAGCYVDGKSMNNISYADDMVLLSPSINGLSRLLNICERYALTHGLLYNVKKSELMVFKTRNKATAFNIPIKLYGQPLKRVSSFKYLGHIVNEDLHDDDDIERERRALAARANMLARRFARCSREVKITLFKSYCQCFYTVSLWVKYRLSALCEFNITMPLGCCWGCLATAVHPVCLRKHILMASMQLCAKR